MIYTKVALEEVAGVADASIDQRAEDGKVLIVYNIAVIFTHDRPFFQEAYSGGGM